MDILAILIISLCSIGIIIGEIIYQLTKEELNHDYRKNRQIT